MITDTENEIASLEKELRDKKQKLTELKRALPPKKISDYTFLDVDANEISLAALFGDKKELMLIHNMGKGCRYCTLWADEYNGVIDHLENRVPFAVISPDVPLMMREFAESRNWKFKILSSYGTSFKKDIGFENDKGKLMPGVSVFIKDETGNIFETNHDRFGPGDAYCGTWSFLDLLPQGSNGWEPQYKY